MVRLGAFRTELIAALASFRLKDGLAPAVLFSDREGLSDAVPCNCVFPSALALCTLASCTGIPRMDQLKRSIGGRLVIQQSEHSSWNYWQRSSPDAEREPYPDDLDTTCCALAGIASVDPRALAGEDLAKAVLLLLANEAETGGPYRTWLVPPDADEAWLDVDPAVNANIGFFLSTQDVQLRPLEAYLEHCLRDGRLRSPYYPSKVATLYFLSRWYRGPSVDEAVKVLLASRNTDGSWNGVLETAWGISALVRWNVPGEFVRPSLDWLAAQGIDRISRPEPLCIHGISSNETKYLGSGFVTLAACLEAIDEYRLRRRELTKEMHADSPFDSLHRRILGVASSRFGSLPEGLKQESLHQLDAIVRSDRDRQVALLPAYFAEALGDSDRLRVSDEFLIQLGAANVYGWMAYTIYDDLLDEEGEARLLPVANVCLRELTQIFTKVLPDDESFSGLFRKTMDGIEAANAWEVANCRTNADGILPDYGDYSVLADRSFGHALGPLAILSFLGYSQDDEQRSIQEFFRQYLIARQLDDDAHDWEEDLERGQINAVGREILEAWKESSGERAIVLVELRAFFWENIAEETCQRILFHCDQAESALAQAACIQKPELLLNALEPVRQSAKKALLERERMLGFLAGYVPGRGTG